MKKIIAGAALVAASVLVATPAMALTKVTPGSIVCQAPEDPSASSVTQYGFDGIEFDTFTPGTEQTFDDPASIIAVDNAKNVVYMASAGRIYSTALDGLTHSNVYADNSASYSLMNLTGLTVDDTTGDLYELGISYSSDLPVVTKFNASTNTMDEYVTLDPSSTPSDLSGLAWYDGHFYSSDFTSGIIHVFDGVTGNETGTLPAMPGYSAQYVASISVMEGGKLFALYSDGSDAVFTFYDLTTGTWDATTTPGVAVRADYDTLECATWGAPVTAPTHELPNTGVDEAKTVAVLGGAAALALAGIALVSMRRRSAA